VDEDLQKIESVEENLPVDSDGLKSHHNVSEGSSERGWIFNLDSLFRKKQKQTVAIVHQEAES